MTGYIRLFWALCGLLCLSGCTAEQPSFGDPGITPPNGWKARGPLTDPHRHLEVNLCQWYQPAELRALDPPPPVSNVAIHITNFSRHDLGSLDISFRYYNGSYGRRRILRLDDYLPAHGSLYTHVALRGNQQLYQNISARVTAARILDTPGSR